VTPTAAAGAGIATASYAGTADWQASTGDAVDVTLLPTAATLVVHAPAAARVGVATSLSATLTSAQTPLAGAPVTLAIGTAACTASTDTNGLATCGVQAVAPLGSQSVVAALGGDPWHMATQANATTIVYGMTTGGSFVVGDVAAAKGSTVTMWSPD